MAERNPNWTRDELILALDLYVRHRPAVLGNTSAAVIELSEVLSQLARTDRERSPTHRNANGVAMKLLNFRPFDPEYTATGKVGLHHTGRGDENVWREFASDPVRLRQTATAIRGALASELVSQSDDEDVDDGMTEAPEGRLLTRLHRQRERDRRLVEAKKKQALRKHGRLFCEACGLTPELTFGRRPSRRLAGALCLLTVDGAKSSVCSNALGLARIIHEGRG